METEVLFNLVMQELRERTTNGNDYSMLRAAGLVRQLILDARPLADQANTRFGLSLVFSIPNQNYKRAILEDDPIFAFTGDFLNPTLPPRLRPSCGKRSEFLAATVLVLDGCCISVKELIAHAANVLGGVHRGTAGTAPEIALSKATRLFVPESQCVAPVQLRHVCRAVLRALEPLRVVTSAVIEGKGSVLPVGIRPKVFAREGGVTFRWRTGAKPIEMLLIDIVGGVKTNRIGILQEATGCLIMRILTHTGVELTGRTEPCVPGRVVHVHLNWSGGMFCTFVNGQKAIELRSPDPPSRLGSAILVGIDVEGKLGADEVVRGFKIDGIAGLGLRRNGGGDGCRISDIAVWQCPLLESEVARHAKVSAEEALGHNQQME